MNTITLINPLKCRLNVVFFLQELLPETNRDAYPPHYACGLCNVAAAPADRDQFGPNFLMNYSSITVAKG